MHNVRIGSHQRSVGVNASSGLIKIPRREQSDALRTFTGRCMIEDESRFGMDFQPGHTVNDPNPRTAHTL